MLHQHPAMAGRLLSAVVVLHWLSTFAAGDRLAVVGAGFAGLTAAVSLQQLGHNVTIFEREDRVVPILRSVMLDGTTYDYLSVALLPLEQVQGGKFMSALAAKYKQPYQPQPASANSISFDNATGPSPVPVLVQPYLTSEQGKQRLVSEVARGFAISQGLDMLPPSPLSAVAAGSTSIDETWAQWAAAHSNSSLYDILGDLLVDSSLSGPNAPKPAAVTLNVLRNYGPSLVRNLLVKAGKFARCR